MPTGTVKWFNDDKGFGFITPDDQGADLFVHHSGINTDGFRTLREGARVSYESEAGPKGPKAVNVTPIYSSRRARRRGPTSPSSSTRAGAGSSSIVTSKLPLVRPLAARARPVEPGRDAVVDRVRAGLATAPGSRSARVPRRRCSVPGQPRVHVRGVAALRALVEHPDRPAESASSLPLVRWPNAIGALSPSGLVSTVTATLRSVSSSAVAHGHLQLDALGDVLARAGTTRRRPRP